MIKNKMLDIKIIFKTYLKILKLFEVPDKFLLYKTTKNSF